MIVNKHMDDLINMSPVHSNQDLRGLRQLYDLVEVFCMKRRSLISIMAANGSANESPGNLQNSEIENDCLNSADTLEKDYSLVSHLKNNKSKLSWSGTFQQLLQFAEELLGLTRESLKVTENETKKTIKTEKLILNWFLSMGT